MNSWTALIEGLETGSERAIARLITRIENRDPGWLDAIKPLYRKSGNAQIVGITGAPGAGKSTLTAQLAETLVGMGKRVGVIAIDPSSPYSGGSILGDRARMNRLNTLDGVFVRSMATRGALGGMCLAARDVLRVLDAARYDYILVETVGVGQDEVEIVRAADLVVVVCVPGLGDGLQAIKAGIMEIADLFVVNKADREGADLAVADIEGMLDLSPASRRPPVIRTVATTGEGIGHLIESLDENLRTYSKDTGWRKAKIKEEVVALLQQQVNEQVRARYLDDTALEDISEEILKGNITPYSVVQDVLALLSDLFGKELNNQPMRLKAFGHHNGDVADAGTD